MLRFLLSFLVLCLASSSALAQRVAHNSMEIKNFRPVGDLRVWTFVVRDSAIGQLVSTVIQEEEVDGTEGVMVEQVLQLDYNKIGVERLVSISSEHFVSSAGYYLGDKMKISINGQTEHLELMRNGEVIEGFSTRAGKKTDQKVVLPELMFAADIQFLDLFEILLAMRDIKVGDEIIDSIFVPQTMLREQIRANIEQFELVPLYNKVTDSVFIISFSRPQEMTFYFTPDKRLVKADFPMQQTKVYLDVVRRLPPSAVSRPLFTFAKFMDLLPLYAIYAAIGLIGLLFFSGRELARLGLYIFLGIGALCFLAAFFTQVPLQTYLVQKVYLPNVNAGDSPFVMAIIPSLPAGFIQEGLKLVVVFLIGRFVMLRREGLLLAGAAVGAGFGIIEASYIVSQFPVTSVVTIGLFERAFQILFHTASGVILASAVSARKASTGVVYFVIAVLANSWLRYLPVMVQQEAFGTEMAYILQPLVPVIIMTFSIYLLKTLPARGD